MRLIQPYSDYAYDTVARDVEKVRCEVPVYFIRYRYPHHAAASGYDRLCDYVGETIRLSRGFYWLGETVLRPYALAVARHGGNYEYSRHDFVMEMQAMHHFRSHRNSIYHYVYGEKQYRAMARLAGTRGNKIVMTAHQPTAKLSTLLRSTEHLKLVDHVIVLSRNQLPFWRDMIGERRVTHVPYAVDTDYFGPADSPAPERPLRCLFVGHHERDFDILPEVVQGVLKRNGEAEFWMISSHPCCEAVSREHERAVWRRRVTDVEYLQLLRNSDLLVLPLVRSTTCTAVLEAMACGMPVVASEGGIQDYLDDASSVTVPVGDPQAMIDTVTDLLKNSGTRRQMSDGALRRSSVFAWPVVAERMVRLYREVLND